MTMPVFESFGAVPELYFTWNAGGLWPVQSYEYFKSDFIATCSFPNLQCFDS